MITVTDAINPVKLQNEANLIVQTSFFL